MKEYIDKAQIEDPHDLLKDPVAKRLVENLALAEWVSRAGLDRERLIETGIVEKRDEMLFRYCSLVIESIRIQNEIDTQLAVAKAMSFSMGHLPDYQGFKERDFKRVVYCAEEDLEPLIDILKRSNSRTQLMYSLRVAHDYYSGKIEGNIEDEFPLVVDCLGLLDSNDGEISAELLKENLEEFLPGLEDIDYSKMIEDYDEYRYGESNPGLQVENLLS
jgi:hypothetical protein